MGRCCVDAGPAISTCPQRRRRSCASPAILRERVSGSGPAISRRHPVQPIKLGVPVSVSHPLLKPKVLSDVQPADLLQPSHRPGRQLTERSRRAAAPRVAERGYRLRRHADLAPVGVRVVDAVPAAHRVVLAVAARWTGRYVRRRADIKLITAACALIGARRDVATGRNRICHVLAPYIVEPHNMPSRQHGKQQHVIALTGHHAARCRAAPTRSLAARRDHPPRHRGRDHPDRNTGGRRSASSTFTIDRCARRDDRRR